MGIAIMCCCIRQECRTACGLMTRNYTILCLTSAGKTKKKIMHVLLLLSDSIKAERQGH